MCEYMITIATKSAPNEVFRARMLFGEDWDNVDIREVNEYLHDSLKTAKWSIWCSFEDPDNVSFSLKNDDIFCIVARRLKDGE